VSIRISRRRQVVGTAGALLALTMGATALTGVSPAASAPTADCTATYPLASVVAGAAVHGLTVTKGTVPQAFNGSVVGTLTDGIAPGVDMVMVKVDPTGLDIDQAEVKGIWQGMSGSPVYAADGRLIGAVAYGLSTQQSWVAGVTPYADMDDYLGTAPVGRVALDRRTAAKVAAAAGVTTAQAAGGFEQLPMPLGVAGVSGRFLHHSAKVLAKHPWLRNDTYAVGRAGAASAATADTIVAGGNLAASIAYGDILQAGLGTATSVCDGQVVGFGHPMNFSGDSTMALHPAEALYVQGDAPSFKVANIGDPVGTVFGDHLTGLTAKFGAAPKATTVSSTVVSGTRSRTGTTYVPLRTADNIAMTTYLQTAMNHARVLDSQAPGSEVLTWTVTGISAAAKPFTLAWTDRYLATTDLADEIGFDVAGLTSTVAGMSDVTVDSVTLTGQASPSTKHYRFVRAEQRIGGQWVKITERRPAFARAGGKLKVRAVLRQGSSVLRLPFTFAVPRSAAGRMATVGFAGGMSTGADFGDNIAHAKRALQSAVRSDVVRAQFGRVTNSDVGGDEGDLEDMLSILFGRRAVDRSGPGSVSFVKTQKSAPREAVMSGSGLAMVVIR
jgi:hypothetical protein